MTLSLNASRMKQRRSNRNAGRTARRRRAVLAGIDEAGRGPFAGPLTLGCVWCTPAVAAAALVGIRDSKHLTPHGREEWFGRLKRHPDITFRVTRIGPATIDRRGMAWALHEGVRRLVRRCGKVRMVYLDGGLFAPQNVPHATIIKGDERVPLIAAASVVAKVSRDRTMLRLHRQYPAYRFDLHKGYGTLLHRKILRAIGISSVHRKGFCRRTLAEAPRT